MKNLVLPTIVMALAVPFAALGQADAVPAFKDLDSMEARVQGCATCHGASGQGTADGYFPRIAGKPAGYLYNQLIAFRDGTRHFAPMNYLLAYLPDAYLRDIANHFARLRPAFTPGQVAHADAAAVERGRALVVSGDSARLVPACAACHGAKLSGMEPGVPGLVGLRPTYIAAQLTRWRIGERRAAEPDCMKRIATRLTESDIAAVAAYMSRQEPAGDASPEPANVQRMPLACGSQR